MEEVVLYWVRVGRTRATTSSQSRPITTASDHRSANERRDGKNRGDDGTTTTTTVSLDIVGMMTSLKIPTAMDIESDGGSQPSIVVVSRNPESRSNRAQATLTRASPDDRPGELIT